MQIIKTIFSMEPTCTWTQGVFYSYFFSGNSTAEICTLVEPYSPLLYTLLFYFMYSVQPSFHKISISTPKKVNGLISWGGGCKKKSWGKPKNLHWGDYRFFLMHTFSLLHCYAFIVRHFHQYIIVWSKENHSVTYMQAMIYKIWNQLNCARSMNWFQE